LDCWHRLWGLEEKNNAMENKTSNDQTSHSANTKTNDQTQSGNQQTSAQEGQQEQGLSKEDLPESTNEATGVPGTGQRQDSN